MMGRGFTIAEWGAAWEQFYGFPPTASQLAYLERCKATREAPRLNEMRRLAATVEDEERAAIQEEG